MSKKNNKTDKKVFVKKTKWTDADYKEKYESVATLSAAWIVLIFIFSLTTENEILFIVTCVMIIALTIACNLKIKSVWWEEK